MAGGILFVAISQRKERIRMKYRKKPVVIEAFQWTGGPEQEDDPEWIIEAIKSKVAWFENAGTPDVGAIQQQLTQAQAVAQKAMIDSAATMTAVSLGIDAKTIPYVLKMADLSQVMGQDGKINDEALKAALNKVLEDVPALKPQASGSTGFIQVGAASGQQQTQATDDALKKAFGL